MRHRLRIVLAALALAAGACGSSESGPDEEGADAAPASEFACQSTSAGDGGEAFPLSLGLQDEAGGYVDLADGDDAPLIIGYQGLYMLILESHADLAFDTDRVCMVCESAITPVADGEFAGTSQNGPIDFVAMPAGQFAGASTVLLGPTSEGEMFSELEVEVAVACEGHGFTGSVQRSVRLMTN